MPIDASRNPYDSPRFDTGGGKAVPTDEPGKSELDDDLDDALDDLGAGTKGPVDTDTDDGDDLDLAGTGTKGELDLDGLDGDVKASAVDGLSSQVGGADDTADGGKGSFDVDDAESDLADSGSGAKGALVLDDGDLDDLGEPDVKAIGGDIGDDLDDDGFSSLKGDGIDDLDLGDAADGGGAFSADLGEVPDVTGKDSFGEDDDSSLFEQKGSILDAVGEEMKGGLDDDADDVDF
jgi:hypothetical protein